MVEVREKGVAISTVGHEQMFNLKVNRIKTEQEAPPPHPMPDPAFTAPLFQKGFSHHQSQCLHTSASCVCRARTSHRFLPVSDGHIRNMKPTHSQGRWESSDRHLGQNAPTGLA